jgi:hypothetical protein
MSNTKTICSLPRKDVFKAEDAVRRLGVEARAWRETITRKMPQSKVTREVIVPAASYLSTGLPAGYKKHVLDERSVTPIVLRVLGTANDDEINRFQRAIAKTPAPTKTSNPFSVGQSGSLGELAGTVANLDGEMCSFAFDLLGKTHIKVVHYSRLRPG